MPLRFNCGCGKVLNVKDENLGKRMKCPQCGAPFTATRESAIPEKGHEAKVSFHVSRGVIIYGAIIILVPSLIAFWKFGPGKTLDEWAKMESDVKIEVLDVISRGIQAHLAHQGLFDPQKPRNAPHALDVTFLISPMPLSMPEKIGFAGNTTTGVVVGRYYPKTGLVEADAEIGGYAIPGVTVRRGTEKIHITGQDRTNPHNVEVNGVSIEKLIPPPRPQSLER